MKKVAPLLAASLLAGGCSQEFEPPDRGVRVEAALAEYSASLFDTIAWSDDAEKSLAGNTVYAERCTRCHGPLGRGDTEYSRSRDLDTPSLVERGWTHGSLDSIRRAVYSGHESGMPIFSERQLTPREIDSSAAYVLYTLRPDVLGRR
jgi:mono/diheme cytochrome c family protein